ncbi:low temperature requirement protein A [Gordonia sp. HY002]|nr:low temperature requirement protein A [Gordonia zhenghanii]
MSSGAALKKYPRRCFTYGYGNIPIYMACAAVGAGLHVVTLSLERESILPETATLVTFTVPDGIHLRTHVYERIGGGTDRRAIVLGAVTAVAGTLRSIAGAPLVARVCVVGLMPVAAVVTLEVGYGLCTSVD